MLLKSVAAGVLTLGLFGAAFSIPASEVAPNADVYTESEKSPEVARPTCCEKPAFCCSVKRSCCGKSVQMQNDTQ